MTEFMYSFLQSSTFKAMINCVSNSRADPRAVEGRRQMAEGRGYLESITPSSLKPRPPTFAEVTLLQTRNIAVFNILIDGFN